MKPCQSSKYTGVLNHTLAVPCWVAIASLYPIDLGRKCYLNTGENARYNNWRELFGDCKESILSILDLESCPWV